MAKHVKRLKRVYLEELVVTDTIPNQTSKNFKKTRQVSVAPLFGEAIRRVTNEESVSSLFVLEIKSMVQR